MQDRQILGVVLAGGSSSRFGADKCAVLLVGKPLLQWVVERAAPQVDALVVNTNSNSGQDIVSPTIARLADERPGEGPLAGILAALRYAGARGFTHVASFACDTPFFPQDTVARLWCSLYNAHAGYAVARCRETAHRIFALWTVSWLQTLEAAFAKGARSMQTVENWLTPGWADFPPAGGPEGDPFFNINTPADLESAERWLAGPVH